LLNVTVGAIAMQATNHIAYLGAAGALALGGALLAMAVSYRLPPRYVSSTVVRIVPAVSGDRPVANEVLLGAAADEIHLLQGLGVGILLLSGGVLSELRNPAHTVNYVDASYRLPSSAAARLGPP